MLLLGNKVDDPKPFSGFFILEKSTRLCHDNLVVMGPNSTLIQHTALGSVHANHVCFLRRYKGVESFFFVFFFFTGTFLTDRTMKKINVDQIDFSRFLPVWTTAWWNLSWGRNNLTFSTDSAVVCPATSSSESPLHVWGFIWRLSNVQSGNTHFLNFFYTLLKYEIWMLVSF